MTLNDRETAQQSGEPINLYKFTYGDTATLCYTDAETDLDLDGTTYEAHTITRGNVKNPGKVAASDLKISVPLNSPVASLFAIYPPSVVVRVEIRQGHIPRGEGLDIANFPINFVGRILESRRNGNVAELTADPSTLARPGLTRNWQWGCPLVLYGTRCAATKTAYPATVLSVTNSSITLVAPDAMADPVVPDWNTSGQTVSKFITGMVEWDGLTTREKRMIRNVTESNGEVTLHLFAPVWDLAADGTVDVYLGCRRTLDDCEDVHNNVLNFGGQPFIPVDGNPVGKNNHF